MKNKKISKLKKNRVETEDPLISVLNYKDILIVLGLWYFMAYFISMTQDIVFDHTYLAGIFHLLFILAGRFIYLALVLFYLTSIYSLSYKELYLRLGGIKSKILPVIPLVSALFLTVLLLINIPLSYSNYENFYPLFRLDNPEVIITSLFPSIIIFFACFVIAVSEQFIISGFIYRLFNNTLFNGFFSLILSSLFYSFLLLTFEPSRILINFLSALISIIIFIKTESLISSSFFIAAYYTIYIVYIYGWGFINF